MSEKFEILSEQILSHPNFHEEIISVDLWTLITQWSFEFKNYCLNCDYWIEVSIKTIRDNPYYTVNREFEQCIEKWCLISRQTSDMIEKCKWTKFGKLMTSVVDSITIRSKLLEEIDRITVGLLRRFFEDFDPKVASFIFYPNIRVDPNLINQWWKISKEVKFILGTDPKMLDKTSLLADAIKIQRKIVDSI